MRTAMMIVLFSCFFSCFSGCALFQKMTVKLNYPLDTGAKHGTIGVVVELQAGE